jgi:hypothetical protein
MTYSTAMEWTKCLSSKKHAERSRLRVRARDEKTALYVVNSIITILVGLLIFTMGMIYGEHRMLERIQGPNHGVELIIKQ